MMYKFKRLILNFLVLAFIFSGINSYAIATTSNLIDQKREAYITLARVLYDSNNNILYRLQVLENLASLEGLKLDSSINNFQKIASKNGKIKARTSEIDIDSRIKYLKDKNYIFAYLLKDLSRAEEESIRELSKNLLKKLNNNEALQVFVEMMKSPDKEEKLIGVKGLSKINIPESATVLLNMLDKASETEKILLTDILCSYKGEQILITVKDLIKIEKNPKVLINLAIVLINNGDKSYAELLQEYSSSENIEDLRYLALKLKDIKADVDFSIVERLSLNTDKTIEIGLISFFEQYRNNNENKSQRIQVIKTLKRYIFDDSELVSTAALKVLAGYQDKEINKIIKPLIYDKELGLTTINIILSTNNKYLMQSIEELARLDNDQIKLQAARCLISYGKKPEKLLKQLANNSKDIDIKLAAAILLNKLSGSNKYLENIALNNKDEIAKDAKDIAVLYLANLKNKNLEVDALKAIAFDGYNDNNSLTAALLLYNYNDNSGFNILRNFLSTRKPVLIAAKYRIENVLLDLLDDDNKWVKLNSAYNLAKMQNKKGIEVLKELLVNTDDPKIRASAAIMLGNTGDLDDIDVLRLSYNDKYSRVRSSAAESVIEIILRSESLNVTKSKE